MTIFGLTGGIACGKSTVASIFHSAGVPMVDADKVARSLVYPGSPVLQEIVRHFGPGVLLEDGNLNRHKLGALVFSDKKKIDLLVEINREPVRAAIAAALKEAQKTASLVGYDCALIVETGQQRTYKPLVVVVTSPKVQIQRLMSRGNFSEEQAKIRINSQMSTTDKLQYADYVIWNDGDKDELLSRTMEVCRLLMDKYAS